MPLLRRPVKCAQHSRAIIWAYRCLSRARLDIDPQFNSKLEVAQVPAMQCVQCII